MLTGYVPGAAVPKPLLARAAMAAPPFPALEVAQMIAPDTEVPSFQFTAPIYGNEGLEAADDDTIGRKSDFLEVTFSEGGYDASIGSHGRKATIGQLDLEKAEEAKEFLGAMAGGGTVNGDPVFDLKARVTTMLYQQNNLHNALLILLSAITPANYRASHVFDGVNTLNVRTGDVLETIQAASNLIEDDAGWPANKIVFGVGAIKGAQQNATLIGKLPDDSNSILTREGLRRMLADSMDVQAGDAANAIQIGFATMRVKDRAINATRPIMDNWIWVGRTVPEQDSVNATFMRNFWKKVRQNRQRVYVNEQVWGVQENITIGLKNHYRPGVTGKDFGVLIETTSV